MNFRNKTARFAKPWLIAIGLFIFTCSGHLLAQEQRLQAVTRYCESLKKPGGGYGWADQYDAHITPNFAVTGVLYNLNRLPKNRSTLIDWTEKHHPQTGPNREAGPSGAEMRDVMYQQVQTITWLNGNLDKFKEAVSKWKSQRTALANYEETHSGNLWQETFTPVTFSLLNISTDMIKPEFTGYLDSVRRPNGSYNNALLHFGKEGDGNILCTVNSILALKALKQDIPLKKELIKWLQACQDVNGGFKHQPRPELAKRPDIMYTWAGVKALKEAGARPVDIKACIHHILSLQNNDGGFGNKPGLKSTPMSTFYAIDALKDLQALGELEKTFIASALPKNTPSFNNKKIFTVQFQSVGDGSPREAVMLAEQLKIDLWGAKNAPKGWIEEAQKVADQNKVKVHFFITDEPYNKNIVVPAMGVFGHILDYFAPAGYSIDFPEKSTWPDLKKNYIRQLLQKGGGLILQVSNNEPLARILLDESVDNGGYVALSTHHFDQNFAFWLPYLFDYQNRLPMICLQDGHGTESWWWSDNLFKERTLFIADNASYSSMTQALQANRMVSVRHDSLTGYHSRIMGSTTDVRDFISANELQWKWWNKQGVNYDQPWAAVTILKPGDKFEKGAPEKGITIRVRCWYKSRQQVLLSPVTELVQLKINGSDVKFECKQERGQRGQLTDAYCITALPEIAAGKYTVEAILRKTGTNETKTIKADVTVNK